MSLPKTKQWDLGQASLCLLIWTFLPFHDVVADEHSKSPLAETQIQALVEPFVKDKPYVALAVGVSEPGSTRMYFFGSVDRDHGKTSPTDETLFEIGSITKTMTCSILATLVEDGKVELATPANRYLDADLQLPDAAGVPITLEQLATHTSSLPVQPPTIGLFALLHFTLSNPYSKYDRTALVSTLKTLKVKTPPGIEYRYSNLGMGMLGHALVAADKAESYEALLRKRLLAPLALHDTTITLSEMDRKNRLATPHTDSGSPTSTWDFAALEGCGAVRSSPRDMVRWLELHMGKIETPMQPALRRAQLVRFPKDREPKPDEIAMGLGWHWIPIPQRTERLVFHNGGTGGSRCFLALDSRHQVGVVILSNSAHSVDDLGVHLMEELLDHHSLQPIEPE